MTLEIGILGENQSRKAAGYLILVPDGDAETDVDPASRQEPIFTFPGGKRRIYEDAQLAKSLASESSSTLAREWLKLCIESHPRCSEADRIAVGRPPRLLDVGGEGRDPKVVVVDSSQDWPVYLTLSHCWGGATILRLLLGNIDTLTKGIPMNDLPPTFRDAVMIARQLG